MGLADQYLTQAKRTPGQEIDESLSKLSPYVSSFSSTNNIGNAAKQVVKQSSTGGGSALDNLGKWLGDTAGQIGGIALGAFKFMADAAVDTVASAVRTPGDIGDIFRLQGQVDANNRQLKSMTDGMNHLMSQYKAGTISREQYLQALKDSNGEWDTLLKQTSQTQTAAEKSARQATSDVLTDAQTIIAIATAGMGSGLTALAVDGAKTAADGSAAQVINFFGKKEVSSQLYNGAKAIDTATQAVVDGVNKVTTFNGKFSSGIVAKLTHEAATTGANNLSAQTIAKNVAVNILLKRPLIYQTNVDLATDMYDQMQKGNIAGIAGTMALTASMALTGGPIGYAMETLGRGGQWLKAATFSKSAMADFMKAENAVSAARGEELKYSENIIKNAQVNGVSRKSMLDATSSFIGDGTLSQGAVTIKKMLASSNPDDVLNAKMFLVTLETNYRRADGNSVSAAGYIRDFFNGLDSGRMLATMNYEGFINHMAAWSIDREKAVQNAIENGMSESEAHRIVIGRMNGSDKQMIIDALSETDKNFGSMTEVGGKFDLESHENLINARKATLAALSENYGRTAAWANSDTLQAKLESVITNPTNVSTDSLAKEIMKIRVGHEIDGKFISDDVKNDLSKNGHLVILPKGKTYTPYVSPSEVEGKKVSTAFVPKGEGGKDSIYLQAVKPIPVLTSVGTFLTKLGLSPDASNDLVQKYFSANFAESMKSTTFDNVHLNNLNGDAIMSRLYGYIREFNSPQGDTMREEILHGARAPITDLRQMLVSEIQAAIDKEAPAGVERITRADAKNIAKALNSSMLKVPYNVRGLGDRTMDYYMTVNPAAAPFARLQGATRFVYNPFFKLQQSFQTEGLAQLHAHFEGGGSKIVQLPMLNKVNKVLFSKQMGATDDTIKVLEKYDIFPSGYSGVGATSDVEGKVGTRIIKSEKTSLAGLVNVMSKNKNYASPEEYVQNNVTEVTDLLRTLTTSNQSKGTLDSPLVRTINLAFFPFRYNLKVASLAADYLGKMSAPAQVAMLYSLFNMQNWIKSDEGLAWQQDHSNALNLFNWLSPTYPLSYVMQLGQDVVDPEDAHIGDLGQLGGLPFGMFSQALESAGIINYQGAYVAPSTGEVYPDYIPKTARAGVNLALQDLISSLFSYPGALVGLPSKGGIIRGVTNTVVGGENEFEKTDKKGELTPEQQKQANFWSGRANGQTNQTQLPTPGQPDDSITSVAPRPLPTIAPRDKGTSTKTAKKKKSQYTPVPIDSYQ
jgi:hypothetical protein